MPPSKQIPWDQLSTAFDFHRSEHENLSLKLVSTLAEHISFQLKIQKASIQFISPPFGVIGLRRSKANIFLEFYAPQELQNTRIIRRTLMPNQLILHRVEVSSSDDLDEELIHWLKESQSLVANCAE